MFFEWKRNLWVVLALSVTTAQASEKGEVDTLQEESTDHAGFSVQGGVQTFDFDDLSNNFNGIYFSGSYHFNPYFGLGLALDQSTSKVSDEEISGVNMKMNGTHLVLNGRYPLSVGLVPYASLGIGSTELEMEYMGFSVSDRGGSIDLNLGADYLITKNWAVGAGVGSRSINTDDSQADDEESSEDSVDATSYRLSASYLF